MANGEAVTVADKDWLQHAYALGGTGSGKTTWLESLMAADLAERRGFCYLDKHGDSAKRIADSSPQPIIYWQPASLSHVIGLNPLHNVPPDERWKVTANIVSVFSDIWGLGEQTPRLIYFLRAALRLLLDTPGSTLLDIRRVLSDPEFRHKLLKSCKDGDVFDVQADFFRSEQLVGSKLGFQLFDQSFAARPDLHVARLRRLTQLLERRHADRFQILLGLFPLRVVYAAELLDECGNALVVNLSGKGAVLRQCQPGQAEAHSQGQVQQPLEHFLSPSNHSVRLCPITVSTVPRRY